MEKWDRTEPKIDVKPLKRTAVSQNTDINEGEDEIVPDLRSLATRISDLERLVKGDNNSDLNSETFKDLLTQLNDLRDRILGMSAECNEDGTITITI